MDKATRARVPGLFDDDGPPPSSAVLSECGRYRFVLQRRMSERIPTLVNFIMLNPSTADASEDDPTLRRCLGFARAWGFGRLSVTNLYALRATDPRDLWAAADRDDPRNDEHLTREALAADRVVCAWGNGGLRDGRGGAVLRRLVVDLGVTPWFLGRLTIHGMPRHPVRLPKNIECWSLKGGL